MKKIKAVIYHMGEEVMPGMILDFNALDHLLKKKLNIPVYIGKKKIGVAKKIKKTLNEILAVIELDHEIGYGLQTLSSEKNDGKIVIKKGELKEIYL